MRELPALSTVVIVGSVDLRLSDPVLVGVAGALVTKLVVGDQRTRSVLFKEYVFWLIFVGWLLFQVLRSLPEFGVVRALGEFRYTFQHILILPYVIVFFRTREQQRRLLLVLLGLSLLLIVVALFKGGVIHRFTFSPTTRWLSSFGSLALVWGALALYLMHRHRLRHWSPALYASLLLATIGITVICNHRSVWLAAGVAILALTLLGQLSFATKLRLGGGLLLVLLSVGLVYNDVDMVAFFQDRFKAFTSFEDDSTARWRYQIWSDALRQSSAHPWEGKGLGNYFEMRDGRGHLVTVSLHNQYVQLIYQVGVMGLLFYAGLVVQVFRRLRRMRAEATHRQDHLLALLALAVLAGATAYYLTYGFDYVTWLYVGLGLAAAQSYTDGE